MKSGNFDRSIIIEQVSLSNDTFGSSQTESWSTFATVWAEVLPVQAVEDFRSQERYSIQRNEFKIRWLSGLTPRMRINYDSKYWKITGIKEIGRHQAHSIEAEVYQ